MLYDAMCVCVCVFGLDYNIQRRLASVRFFSRFKPEGRRTATKKLNIFLFSFFVFIFGICNWVVYSQVVDGVYNLFNQVERWMKSARCGRHAVAVKLTQLPLRLKEGNTHNG